MLEIKKEQLAGMPTAVYDGRVIVVDNASDCRSAISYLLKQPVVGFDTETRPSFKKGHPHSVALLQLSTLEECFLIRLNRIGLTDDIVRLFECADIVKVGLSVRDDISSMMKLKSFEPRNVVELQTYVKQFDIADNSLQKVYGIIFGSRISKGQRLSNWEAENLSESQQAYAALDAYACIKIYRHLMSGCFDPESSPYHMEDIEESRQSCLEQ